MVIPATVTDVSTVDTQSGEFTVTSMAEGAFKNTAITSINIEAPITSIPANAFYGATNLATVSFTSNVTSLGQYAFYGCSSLTSVADAGMQNVTDIGAYAFQNCSSLPTLKLAEGLTEIKEYVFNGCSELKNIVIPSTVTEIGKYAFTNCTSLICPTFPEGLQTISASAFQGCTALGDVTFPAGVTLGNSAFRSSYITSITWPKEAIKFWGSYCFYQVSGLTELSIPDYMTTIPNRTFYKITSLTKLTLPERMDSIGPSAFNGCTALSGKLTIPIGVNLDSEVFGGAAFTEIEIPEAEVGTWSDNCLGELDNITSIKFPSTMTAVPAGVCNSWANLSEVVFNGQDSICSKAFYKCKKLASIDLSNVTKLIGGNAFYQCAISSVTLQPGVTVDDNAFYQNPLTEINFPETECYFNKDCFASSKSEITSIEFPSWMTSIPAGFCKSWPKLQSATYGDQVTSIGDYAFYHCTKLSGMNFDNISNFGAYSFAGCSSTDPKFVEVLKLKDGAVIGDHAFDGAAVYGIEFEGCAEFGQDILKSNKYISSIKFPECMTEIPDGFCSNWKNLEKVVLPPAVTKIGVSSFSGCTKITKVAFDAEYDYNAAIDDVETGIIRIPATVTDVEKAAFQSAGIKEVVSWPKDSISLGTYLFAQTSISKATFPDWMTEIPDYMYYKSSVSTIEWDLDKITSLGVGTFAYTNLYGEITLPNAVTRVPKECFRHCGLTKVNVPETLTYYGKGCFADNHRLKMDFHEGLLAIDQGAFYKTGFVDLVLPKSLTSLNNGAFAECDSLKTVTCYATDLNMEYNAVSLAIGIFDECKNLETVTFTSHLKTISAYCFEYCTNLKTFNYPEGDWIDRIEPYAFLNCSSLEDFPYLKHTDFAHTYINRNGEFQGCSSLTQIVLPEEVLDQYIYYTNPVEYSDGYHPYYLFSGATSLQSLIFPYTGKTFDLSSTDIENVPLKGISYSYAQGMSLGKISRSTRPLYQIVPYDGNNDKTIASPETSNLYVVRGEKWKYMEAGYGDVFNIIEMKDPQVRLEGDLFSEYDATQNVNHYTVSLRWPMLLSDFNENGETLVDIYREGVEEPVAKIVFSKPSEPKEVDGLDADKVVEVKYTVNGHEDTFTGDFVLHEKYGPAYQLTQATCGPSLYFNAETSKRVGSFDDEDSWFAFTDKFDSPVLSEPGVPTSYTYRAVMHSYAYDKLENNEDLSQPAEDGMYYHVVHTSTGDLESTSPNMVVPMALPELSFQGLYSSDDILGNDEAEVEGDEDHHLTACSEDNRDYVFNYVLDEELTKQVGREYSDPTTKYIITSVTLDELDAEGNVNQIGDPVELSTSATYRSNTGRFSVSDITVGNRYQTVTHTTFRGTFGSPVITVPGVPKFDSSVTLSYTDHYNSEDGDDNTHGIYKPILASIDLTPYLSGLGYEDGELPAEGDYRIAVWRTLPGSTDGEELVYFNGDNSVTYNDTNLCVDCETEEGVTVSEGNDSNPDELTYNDVFNVNQNGLVEADYVVRVYVKVPEGMLRDDDAWMLVEIPVNTSITVSGVENVSADDSAEYAVWYDLQGRPVEDPLAGQTYIRVTSRGAEKVIFK